MKKMLLLFSHKLSEKQIQDAEQNYEVNKFIYLPNELQKIWSNISPNISSIKELLPEIKIFTQNNTKKYDVVLIQGDFGAVYEMVYFCKSLGLVCVYATTKRKTTEYINKKGEAVKKSIFEHRRFREYGK